MLINERHAATEAYHNSRELKSHVAAAENDQMFGQPVEFQLFHVR